MRSSHHGSPEVWDDIWEGADKKYSEKLKTQNQVFEHVKIKKLESIFPNKKKKMLEVGCGTAFVSLYFAKRKNDVTCLDTNKNILKIARKNFEKEGARGKFIVGNAEKLPFKANTFDVVTSFGLLEHFDDPAFAIKEMIRVTKKGGIIFADIVPDRFSCQSFGNVFNFFASIFYWTFQGDPVKGYKKGLRNIRPLYYENSYSWDYYKKIFRSLKIKSLQIKGNRPFPRLTLPAFLDELYARFISFFLPVWEKFDSSNGWLSRFWGAGWWFWGYK